MNRKVRHQRTIKNGIVPIDDVEIEPGINFTNWIPEVRRKLAERESILLEKRVNIFNQIISSTLTQFYDENGINFKHIDSIKVDRMHSVNVDHFNQSFINGENVTNIKTKCEQVITQQLAKWKGVRRSKKVVNVFRDYFKVSKNWFDQRKIELIATHFCIPLINLVHEISNAAAAQFFANQRFDFQRKYSNYLSVFLLRALCRGIIKLPNCGERLLIPAGVHLTINKHDIPIFDIMTNGQQSVIFEDNKGAKNARKLVMELLDTKYEIYKHEFVVHLHQQPDVSTDTSMVISNSSNSSTSSIPPSVISTSSIHSPPIIPSVVSSENDGVIQEQPKPEYPMMYKVEPMEEEKIISIPAIPEEPPDLSNINTFKPSPNACTLTTSLPLNGHSPHNVVQNVLNVDNDDLHGGHFSNDFNDVNGDSNFNFNNFNNFNFNQDDIGFNFNDHINSNFNASSDCFNTDTFNFNHNHFNVDFTNHQHSNHDHINNDHHHHHHQPPPQLPPQTTTQSQWNEPFQAPQIVSIPSPLSSIPRHRPLPLPNFSPPPPPPLFVNAFHDTYSPRNHQHQPQQPQLYQPPLQQPQLLQHHQNNYQPHNHQHHHHQFTGHGYINHHDSTYHLSSTRWSPY